MLNWIVWNRTDYLYKMDLALKNLQRLTCHKNPTNQPTNQPTSSSCTNWKNDNLHDPLWIIIIFMLQLISPAHFCSNWYHRYLHIQKASPWHSCSPTISYSSRHGHHHYGPICVSQIGIRVRFLAQLVSSSGLWSIWYHHHVLYQSGIITLLVQLLSSPRSLSKWCQHHVHWPLDMNIMFMVQLVWALRLWSSWYEPYFDGLISIIMRFMVQLVSALHSLSNCCLGHFHDPIVYEHHV